MGINNPVLSPKTVCGSSPFQLNLRDEKIVDFGTLLREGRFRMKALELPSHCRCLLLNPKPALPHKIDPVVDFCAGSYLHKHSL